MENIIIDEQELNIRITSDDVDIVVSDEYSTDYDLPIASDETLGGVKIGDNVDITSDGTISIPTATDETLGVVKAGSNISIASDGTISATGGSFYVLPQATNVTLGGVYVDTALSSVSQNPVQNKIISSNLNTLSNSITSLQGTVESQGDTITNAVGAISLLQDTDIEIQADISDLDERVAQNTQDISTNASNIGANTADIVTLKSRMGTAEDNITSLTNGANEMSGNLETLLTTISEMISYSDIANYWTAGSVNIVGKGKMAYVVFDLNGSLTISSGSYENILEITDDDLKPKYAMEGMLITDAGVLKVRAFTSGIIKAYNLSSSNITLTTLSGNIPIILN